jgi:hypothetical protein
LCNEPNCETTRLSSWLQALRPLFEGPGQSCGIGVFSTDDSLRLGEGADWHSVHISCCKVPENLTTGKPVILQEGWVPTPTDAQGQDDVAAALHKGIARTLASGGAGFMTWNWNRLANRWRADGSFVESWDYELGVAEEDDGVPRRGQTVLRQWATFMDGIRFDQSHDRQVVVVMPARTISCDGMDAIPRELTAKRIAFRAVNDRDFASDDLSGARLVVLPYGGAGWRDATWNRLQKFAGDGGLVWAHVDRLLLDEFGRNTNRAIPWRDRAEAFGKGRFEFVLGWNRDRTVPRFSRLIESLSLTVADPERRPLADGGEMRFTFRNSTEERTMRTDWVPGDLLPEQRVVTRVEVLNLHGRLQRGFAMRGERMEDRGLVISSDGAVFCLRRGERELLISGSTFTVSGLPATATARLLALDRGNHPRELDMAVTPTACGEGSRFTLHGWQQRHWLRIQWEEGAN